jgi:hypothetical protein
MTPTIADTIVSRRSRSDDQNEKCSRQNGKQCKNSCISCKTEVLAAAKSAAAGSASGRVNRAMKWKIKKP